MQQNKALAQNTAIQIVGKMLAVFFGLYTVSLLANYLGTSGYGELTIILNYLAIFAVVVDFGLTLTTVQMISEKEADEERLIGNLMSLRLITAIIFLALAPVIAIFFPYSEAIKIGIAIGAVSYLFGTSSQLFVGVFQKRLIMSRAVIAELINRVVVLGGIIVAFKLGVGLLGIMWIFVFGNLAQLFTILYFTRKQVRLRMKLELSVWKNIISKSWSIGLSILFNLIYLRGDIIFLSFFRPTDEIGIYALAYKVVDVMTVVPVMYMGLVLPMLVAAWTSKKQIDFARAIQTAFDFFAIIAIPFAFGAIALGTPLMILIANADFAESGKILAILGPATSVLFFGSLFGHAIVGINKQKPMVIGYAAVAVITVAGYLLFIPQYGIWAAAWWTLIAEVLITIVTFIVVVRVGKYTPKLRMFSKALFASLVMYTALFLLPSWHVLILIAVGSVIYYITLSAVGGPKLKDVAALFLPEKPPIVQP